MMTSRRWGGRRGRSVPCGGLRPGPQGPVACRASARGHRRRLGGWSIRPAGRRRGRRRSRWPACSSRARTTRGGRSRRRRSGGPGGQQRLPVTFAAVGRRHVQVFEVDAVTAKPGREVEEPDGHADHLAVDLHDVAEHGRARSEQDLPELILGGDGGVGLALVLGQLADQSEQGGHVRDGLAGLITKGDRRGRRHPANRRRIAGRVLARIRPDARDDPAPEAARRTRGRSLAG